MTWLAIKFILLPSIIGWSRLVAHVKLLSDGMDDFVSASSSPAADWLPPSPAPPIAPVYPCDCSCSTDPTVYASRVHFCFHVTGCYKRRESDNIPELVMTAFLSVMCPTDTFFHGEYCYERGCYRYENGWSNPAFEHACCGAELDMEQQEQSVQLAVDASVVIVALLAVFACCCFSSRCRRRLLQLVHRGHTHAERASRLQERTIQRTLKALPTHNWKPQVPGSGSACNASSNCSSTTTTSSSRASATVASAVTISLPSQGRDAEPPVEPEICSLCLDAYNTGELVRSLPCNHLYHAECIDQWLLVRQRNQPRSCPLCKRNPMQPNPPSPSPSPSATASRES